MADRSSSTFNNEESIVINDGAKDRAAKLHSSGIEPPATIRNLIPSQDTSDSFVGESDQLPVPEWQARELSRRYILYQAGCMDTQDWREVHAALRPGHR